MNTGADRRLAQRPPDPRLARHGAVRRRAHRPLVGCRPRSRIGPVVRLREYDQDPNTPRAHDVLPAAFAAVRNRAGELLLVRRTDDGNWELPGGRIEVGETAATTVVREVAEEPGNHHPAHRTRRRLQRPHPPGRPRRHHSAVKRSSNIGSNTSASTVRSKRRRSHSSTNPSLTGRRTQQPPRRTHCTVLRDHRDEVARVVAQLVLRPPDRLTYSLLERRLPFVRRSAPLPGNQPRVGGQRSVPLDRAHPRPLRTPSRCPRALLKQSRCAAGHSHAAHPQR
jgi:hypothetical protein